jgi:trans-2,3-dihydro-3-hydroxyanthranilate isomerase
MVASRTNPEATDMLPFHVYDVFTATPFTGNPLAIVEDADGLSPAQMQTIARQFNLSETIFVQTPDDPAHTAKVRIFFPTAEIPFAGHPTIGCALHLAGDTAESVTLEEVAGLVPVTISRDGRRHWRSSPPPNSPARFGHARPRDHGRGPRPGPRPTSPPRLRQFRGRARVSSTWNLPTSTRSPAPASGEPAFTTTRETAGDTGAIYAYVRTGPGNRIQARMFDPPAGIREDPATGSATAILSGQLLATGALAEGTSVWSLRQGVEMGRPSDLRLTIDVARARSPRSAWRGRR